MAGDRQQPEDAVVETSRAARTAAQRASRAADATRRLAQVAAEQADLAAVIGQSAPRRAVVAASGGAAERDAAGRPLPTALSVALDAAELSQEAASSATSTAADAGGAAGATIEALRVATVQAAELAALRRVATMVARGMPSAAVFAGVTEEVARAFGAHAVQVRQAAGDAFVPMASWRGSPRTGVAEGSTTAADRITVPIRTGGRFWGVLEAIGPAGPGLGDRAARLGEFAELVGLAVANEETRRRLAEMADRDPLTGLPNHRSFQRLLRRAFGLAHRHGRPLSVAVIDVDDFRALNDTFGHRVGDDVMVEIARRLQACCRRGDTVARVGGDELAVLLPETSADAGHELACRAHDAVCARPIGSVPRVTISVGLCDVAHARSAAELLRLADAALSWAKSQGRDTVCTYTPTGPEALSSAERAERLARSQALAGLRALARAIDAKDASTMQHSERVADLARRLALGRGWDARRAAMLAEVALVHDVGKIGVPDAVLLKPGRLTPVEYEVVKEHAALGAKITSEILAEEQVAWLRGHHERFDGRGYPDGLAGDAIPEGARLLAMVDSYDAMTASRSYCAALPPDAALAQCTDEAGRQFDPEVVAALQRMLDADPP